VAWGRDHIERADPIAGIDGSVGLGLGARVAAAELVLRLVRIEAHVLGAATLVLCATLRLRGLSRPVGVLFLGLYTAYIAAAIAAA
jgi:Ca2+/Na+ antiporter